MIHWIEIAVLLPLALIIAYAFGRLHGLRAADRIHKKYAMPESIQPARPMPEVEPSMSERDLTILAMHKAGMPDDHIMKALAMQGDQRAKDYMRRRDDNRAQRAPEEPWQES